LKTTTPYFPPFSPLAVRVGLRRRVFAFSLPALSSFFFLSDGGKGRGFDPPFFFPPFPLSESGVVSGERVCSRFRISYLGLSSFFPRQRRRESRDPSFFQTAADHFSFFPTGDARRGRRVFFSFSGPSPLFLCSRTVKEMKLSTLTFPTPSPFLFFFRPRGKGKMRNERYSPPLLDLPLPFLPPSYGGWKGVGRAGLPFISSSPLLK